MNDEIVKVLNSKIEQEKVYQRTLREEALQALLDERYQAVVVLVEDIIDSKNKEKLHAQIINETKV